MGNEMGNSNVTGLQEQHITGVQAPNTPSAVSNAAKGEALKEEKLSDLDCDPEYYTAKEAKEVSHTSIQEQTPEEKEKEENKASLATTTADPPESPSIESEEVKPNDPKENASMALEAKDDYGLVETVNSNEPSATGEKQNLGGKAAEMSEENGTPLHEIANADGDYDFKAEKSSKDRMVGIHAEVVQKQNTVGADDALQDADKGSGEMPKKVTDNYETSAQNEAERESLETVSPSIDAKAAGNEEEFSIRMVLKEGQTNDSVETLHVEAVRGEEQNVSFEAHEKDFDMSKEEVGMHDQNSSPEDSKEIEWEKIEYCAQGKERKDSYIPIVDDDKYDTNNQCPTVEDDKKIRVEKKENAAEVREEKGFDIPLETEAHTGYPKVEESKVAGGEKGYIDTQHREEKDFAILGETERGTNDENPTVHQDKEIGEDRMENAAQDKEHKEMEEMESELVIYHKSTTLQEDKKIGEEKMEAAAEEKDGRNFDISGETESDTCYHSLEDSIGIGADKMEDCDEIKNRKGLALLAETEPGLYDKSPLLQEDKDIEMEKMENAAQNKEEKEKKSDLGMTSENTLGAEESEDESEMIEIAASLTEFIVPSSIQENCTGKEPETTEAAEGKGEDDRNSHLCLSYTASGNGPELVGDTENANTGGEFTGETNPEAVPWEPGDLNKTSLSEEQDDLLDGKEQETLEPISADTETTRKEQISAQANLVAVDHLFKEIQQTETGIESETHESMKRAQETHMNIFRDTEKCEISVQNPTVKTWVPKLDPLEKFVQAANLVDEPLDADSEPMIDIKECTGHYSLNVGPSISEEKGDSYGERISFDFQNPVRETKFPALQLSSEGSNSNSIFSTTAGSRLNQEELVTKASIAETEVLRPTTTKDILDETPSLDQRSSSDVSTLNSDSGKMGNSNVGSLQKQETLAENSPNGDSKSPDKKIIPSSSTGSGKQRTRSSLFTSCLCCTAVIQ